MWTRMLMPVTESANIIFVQQIRDLVTVVVTGPAVLTANVDPSIKHSKVVD